MVLHSQKIFDVLISHKHAVNSTDKNRDLQENVASLGSRARTFLHELLHINWEEPNFAHYILKSSRESSSALSCVSRNSTNQGDTKNQKKGYIMHGILNQIFLSRLL